MTKAQKASTADGGEVDDIDDTTAKKGARAAKTAKTATRSATTGSAAATKHGNQGRRQDGDQDRSDQDRNQDGDEEGSGTQALAVPGTQRERLIEERDTYLRSADELKAQADSLALEHEPGDVQFDEEGGEGGTSNVDRELDLVLSGPGPGGGERDRLGPGQDHGRHLRALRAVRSADPRSPPRGSSPRRPVRGVQERRPVSVAEPLSADAVTHRLVPGVVAGVVVAVDQATKTWALHHLPWIPATSSGPYGWR